MRYYLSGPMRPHPENNFPMFINVAKQLRSDGYDIISPHEWGDGDTMTRGELMTEDLLLILNECDGIICLPGWQDSAGASAEVAICFGTEKPVLEFIPKDGLDFLTGLKDGKPGYSLIPSPVVSVTVPREDQYAKKIPLLGLCGFAQSGKDTVASLLVNKLAWSRVAFADVLRDFLYAMNPLVVFEDPVAVRNPVFQHGVNYPVDFVETEATVKTYERLQTVIDTLGWDKAKTGYEEIRKLLQRLGTEAGRDIIDQNLWVRIGENKIESANGPVVVTDCRFPNEIKLIQRRRGKLVWIDRPGVGAANSHASEHSITRDDCDLVIVNDGNIETDLWSKVESLVQ